MMPNLSCGLPEALSEHPEATSLMAFLERLLSKHGGEIEFVVVFGSAAKGKWTVQSDLDVFVGLSIDDGLRLIDRIGFFTQLAQGNLEIFPYARSQWQRMFETLHPMLLDVLEDGIVLTDKGSFTAMRTTFRHWRETGQLIRNRYGWRIALNQEVTKGDC